MNREELIQRTAIAVFTERFQELSRLHTQDTVTEMAAGVLTLANSSWVIARVLADAQPKNIGGEESIQRPDDHMGNEIQEQRIARIENRLGKIQVSVETLLQEYGLGNDT